MHEICARVGLPQPGCWHRLPSLTRDPGSPHSPGFVRKVFQKDVWKDVQSNQHIALLLFQIVRKRWYGFSYKGVSKNVLPKVQKEDFQSICEVPPTLLSSNRQQAGALKTHCEVISQFPHTHSQEPGCQQLQQAGFSSLLIKMCECDRTWLSYMMWCLELCFFSLMCQREEKQLSFLK